MSVNYGMGIPRYTDAEIGKHESDVNRSKWMTPHGFNTMPKKVTATSSVSYPHNLSET